MRKMIAVLIMITVVGVYAWSATRDTNTTSEETQENTVDPILSSLQETEQLLLTNYPTTAKEVMELYNNLIKYTYGEEASEEHIQEAVKVIRMLYGAELIASNPYEMQVMTVMGERVNGIGKKLHLLSSGVESIEFVDEETAIIEVIHYMAGVANIKREYYLVIEENQWKVHSWSNEWYDETYN